MNQIRKTFIQCLLILFILTVSLFSQNVELITQKINVENAIRDKVNVTINKLLEQSQYIIIVNARMDLKPFSLSANNSGKEKLKQGASYNAIPGLLPAVPQNIKQTTGKTYQYSADKYLLYGLDIAVYLESSIATGAMKKNIQTLVKESIPEIQDCDDCIRFETMNMSASGSSSTYRELLKKIEKLEEDKREAEQQILNWKFDELDKQLAISEDARTDWETQARQRETSRQVADSVRLANLEAIEREYRKKQDSLYLITSIKLDETVRGRLESNDQLTNKLMDIIKSGIDPNADADLLSSSSDKGTSPTMLILIIVGVILFLALIGILMLSMSRKTIYLKPKAQQTPGENNNSQSADIPTTVDVNPESETTSFDPTHANDNTDVARSNLKDLRQSTVALGISQKDGSNQIINDWLDTSPDDPPPTDEATTDE